MKLSHVDMKGNAIMVDVSRKESTLRTASAGAEIILGKDLLLSIKGGSLEKGDVLSVSRIAGIQAAKKTSELIPLCHNIFISSAAIDFVIDEKKSSIAIKSTVKTNSVTGVEMEALTSVSVAALTVYDMCKAVDKSIIIKNIRLLSKTGGKSGTYAAK